MTRVEITTAGHSVVIDAKVELDAAAETALRLWRDTRDPRIDSAYGTTGFQAERVEAYAEPGSDLTAR